MAIIVSICFLMIYYGLIFPILVLPAASAGGNPTKTTKDYILIYGYLIFIGIIIPVLITSGIVWIL